MNLLMLIVATPLLGFLFTYSYAPSDQIKKIKVITSVAAIGISFLGSILLSLQFNNQPQTFNLLSWIKIKEQTIELRKKHSIKLPDAIIAATSLVYGLPLVTADKGFSKIDELDLILVEF